MQCPEGLQHQQYSVDGAVMTGVVMPGQKEVMSPCSSKGRLSCSVAVSSASFQEFMVCMLCDKPTQVPLGMQFHRTSH